MEPLAHTSLISNDSLLALQRFKEACDSIESWSRQYDNDPTSEDISYAWTRFRVWADNIGALQSSKARSSLDYRLRHSDVHAEVRRLLRQLLSTLEDLSAIFNNVRQQQVWPSEHAESDPGSFISSNDSTSTLTDGSEDDSPDPEVQETTAIQTESGQLLLIITNTISSLLGLSLIIQRSARERKFAKSSLEGEFTTEHDSLYIQDRFSHIRSRPKLIERLARANGRRRQWLAYRKRHRAKLAAGSVEVGDAQSREGAAIQTTTSEERTRFLPEVSVIGSSAARSTLLSGTTATSMADGALDSLEEESQIAASEATSYLDSQYSALQEGHLHTPAPPPEVETGMPFECPYCFAMVIVKSARAWRKHVHADLASYQCTFDKCNHDIFESRDEWFSHEMELHRQEWYCSICSNLFSNAADYSAHLNERHAGRFNSSQLPALIERSARSVLRIPVTDCPFCEFEAVQQDTSSRQEESTQNSVSLLAFNRHLGHHLEQVALFVLPREATAKVHDDDDAAPGDDDPAKSDSNASVAGSLSTQDGTVSEDMLDLDDDDESIHEDVDTVPDLALGWLPPHNFTPPTPDFATEDSDMVPRREDALFGGDVFTPGWVRGYGLKKEGFCGRCVPGVWLNIEDKSYERNLTYMHGIPCNGIPIPRPSAIRQREDESRRWDAYCEKCEAWRELRKTSGGWNWFRHYLKEHSVGGIADAVVPPLAGLQLKHADLLRHIRAKDHSGCVQLLELEPRVLTLPTPEGRNIIHVCADVGDEAIMDAVVMTLQRDAHTQTLGGPTIFINALTSLGETPLSIASSQGHAEIVTTLLQCGADVNLCGADKPTALDNAAEAGHSSIVKQLLDAGADTTISSVYLQLNAARKRSRQLERTRSNTTGGPASSDATIKVAKDQVLSPLHIAASIGNVDLVSNLVSDGSDKEVQSSEGETALMIAAIRGHVEVARVLLEAGADIHATTPKGWTALMLATKARKERMVETLLVHGADVNHLSPDHWTALAEASHQQQAGILKRLLTCGADTESRSSHDWTPLMHAAYNGDKEATRYLLDAGAALEITSLHDETALLLAIAGGHTDIAETLLEAGCQYEPSWVARAPDSAGQAEPVETVLGGRDSQVGWTPAMLACQTGNIVILRRLLDMGASTLPTSAMGKTALEIANENGFVDIAVLLEELADRG